MIKDALLKLIFIPLLGIGLPVIAGIISYDLYSVPQLIGANIFFILTSFVIWGGCNWIHYKLRPLYAPVPKLFSRIAVVCFVSALYGACTGGLSSFIWIKISKETFNWTGTCKFIAVCVAAVIIFTLVYEILFLSKDHNSKVPFYVGNILFHNLGIGIHSDNALVLIVSIFQNHILLISF